MNCAAPRVWESVTSSSNAEYRDKFYTVPEAESPLEVELAKHLPEDELEQLSAMKNKATRLISAQSITIKDLFASQELAVLHHTEMQKTLKDLLEQQSKAERIKNFRTRGSTRGSTRSSSGASPPCCPFASFANSIA